MCYFFPTVNTVPTVVYGNALYLGYQKADIVSESVWHV